MIATREEKAQEFLRRFELFLNDNDEVVELDERLIYDGDYSNAARDYAEYAEEMSHMTGDLDKCGTTITRKEQPINPKRLKKINDILRTKGIYDRYMQKRKNNRSDVDF